jgi:AcrR family transcriptional regulator
MQILSYISPHGELPGDIGGLQDHDRNGMAEERLSNTEISSQRERILDAAESCFERWGAAKTSIDDVANEAGLSRATVYRCIGNRSELITALGIRSWDREAERWLAEDADGLSIRERLVAALLWSREWVLSFAEPSLARALSESAHFQQYSHDWYVALLGEMRDAGELAEATHVEALARWVLFVRSALWADTTSSSHELRGLLDAYLLPCPTRDPRS